MEIRLNRPNFWRLSLTGALVAADFVEGRPRYHLHSDVRFNPDLAYGKYSISSFGVFAAWTGPDATRGARLGVLRALGPESVRAAGTARASRAR